MRSLGSGSSKDVYLALDADLERDVAIGLCPGGPLPEGRHRRVLREVRTLAGLGDHPHIATVHDLGEQDAYVVSQIVPGGSVADRLARAGGPLPLDEALKIARAVADALSYVHERKVLHRDVKPSNVWLARDAAAILGDFGVALVAGGGDAAPAFVDVLHARTSGNSASIAGSRACTRGCGEPSRSGKMRAMPPPSRGFRGRSRPDERR